eukprot:scaffold13913_cov64-Phaeocystis_antarctica.AAC.3
MGAGRPHVPREPPSGSERVESMLSELSRSGRSGCSHATLTFASPARLAWTSVATTWLGLGLGSGLGSGLHGPASQVVASHLVGAARADDEQVLKPRPLGRARGALDLGLAHGELVLQRAHLVAAVLGRDKVLALDLETEPPARDGVGHGAAVHRRRHRAERAPGERLAERREVAEERAIGCRLLDEHRRSRWRCAHRAVHAAQQGQRRERCGEQHRCRRAGGRDEHRCDW